MVLGVALWSTYRDIKFAGIDYVISRGFFRGEPPPPGPPTAQPWDQRTNPGAGGTGLSLADVLIMLTYYLLPIYKYYIITSINNLTG